MTLRTASPWLVGLVQAFVISVYIVLFALVVQTMDTLDVDKLLPEIPVVIMPIMLTTFVFSALVCGGSALGYPLVLLFGKQVTRAIQIIIWTGVWLAAFVGLFLTIGFTLGQT